MENEAIRGINKIKKLLDDERLTDYRISKQTGIAISRIWRLRHGDKGSKVENISLGVAVKLIRYYNQINDKHSSKVR